MSEIPKSSIKRSLKIAGVTVCVVIVGLITTAAILMSNFLHDANDNAKPNSVMLWEKNIPYYQDSRSVVDSDVIKAEMGIIPGFVVDKVLDSNFQMKPKLQLFALKNGAKNPAIIIYPGGGYMGRAEGHEGVEVANWLNSIGIAAFVLDYRVVPYQQPTQILDAKRAIRYLRFHAREYNIDPDRIGVIGFSAGGHLASTLGTHFDPGNPSSEDPVERMSSRPDLMLLSYAVISMGEFTHPMSKLIFLGPNPSNELVAQFSNEKQVSSQTPPTFLWHTANDSMVPVENAYLFAEALKKNHVEHELHIFADGFHGLGLAQGKEEVKEWPGMAEKWLRSNGF